MLFSESDILVYTSIYIVYVLFKFIITPPVHFTSFSLRLVPPKSLNSTRLTFMPVSLHEVAFYLQLPQLTDHPGYTRKSKIYTYIHVYTCIYLDQLCRCCSLALLHSLDANSTWKRAGDVHTNSPPSQHQDDPPQCSKDRVEVPWNYNNRVLRIPTMYIGVYTSIYKHIHQHSMNNFIPLD